MKRRWLILLASLALLLLLVAWGGGWLEPRYQGKRASTFVFETLDTPRFFASDATNKFKPMGAKLALPPLIKALEYEDSVFRQKYTATHAKAPKLVQKFLPQPRSVQHLRRNAITALAAFGPEAAPAVPALVRIYARGDSVQRNSMTSTLASIGPGARPVVPWLLDELTNSPARRYPFAILRALGAIDITGELSVHEVIPFAGSSDYSAGTAALDAIGSMSRATPALATNLWRHVHDDTNVRSSPSARGTALRNLNNLGLLTRDALAPYFLELTNGQSSQRLKAIFVVTFSTNFAEELVPLLCRFAREDTDASIQSGVINPLLNYGSRTNIAPELREDALFLVFFRNTNQPSWAAMDAIRSLSPRGTSLVPLLIPVLTHADPRMRGKAAEALAQIGPAAWEAAPRLRPLLNDEWLFVREAATNALRAGGVTP